MTDNAPKIDTEKVKELAKLRAVLELPGMHEVLIRKDLLYKTHDGNALTMDIYRPPEADGLLPAVIFVVGYSDAGAMEHIGYRLKDMGPYVSWGQLVAASGLIGITYSSASPPEDARDLIRFVRAHSRELNVDPQKIGIWAASGNGPTALSLLKYSATGLRFAVLCNTYMLDLDGDSTVADNSAIFGFAAPNAGMSLADLDADTPMLVVRSGRDEIPGLNDTLDRFVASAIELNRPLQLANLPDAPHGFDILHDTQESREVIANILAFMRANTRS